MADVVRLDQQDGKLEQTVIGMDKLSTEAAPAFKGADACFCTLGTTRGDAGTAEAFIKVCPCHTNQVSREMHVESAKLLPPVSCCKSAQRPASRFVL